jgi:predicted  nucleic acid-binding Zn-ribbon protein
VTHVACSICKIPYTPGVERILHFCPRPGCRKFYHQSCLVKHDYVEETRKHRLLETWPDIDRTAPVEKLHDLYPGRPRKRQKIHHSDSEMESEHDPLSGIPAQLVAVAEQPIVRGTQGGGVVGNIASVAAARELIFKSLSRGSLIPDDWESKIDTSTAAFSDTDTLPNCICPNCYSPI